MGTAMPPKQQAALKAAVEWVLDPDEPKRREAQEAGQDADFGTPAGCAALAVYGSGGSLTPANLPEVPPGPYLTAKAASGGIALAAAEVSPEVFVDVHRELVELGILIAEGKVAWPRVQERRPIPRRQWYSGTIVLLKELNNATASSTSR